MEIARVVEMKRAQSVRKIAEPVKQSVEIKNVKLLKAAVVAKRIAKSVNCRRLVVMKFVMTMRTVKIAQRIADSQNQNAVTRSVTGKNPARLVLMIVVYVNQFAEMTNVMEMKLVVIVK